MLRIRFNDEAVTVTHDDGPNSSSVTEKYDKVEVDFMHRKRFWCRLAEPLKALRVAAHLQAAVWLLSERKKENGGGEDGV